MATAATAACPDEEFVDKRNLEWKSDNIGSKLLAKMGWREGQAVGKRQREQGLTVTGQGLRAVKRREGLGIGAALTTASNAAQPQHVGDFGQVLAALREEHGQPLDEKKKRKKNSSKTAAVLPTNITTHAAVRQAKFQQKSVDDMKCIFAGATFDFPKIVTGDVKEEGSKKRKTCDEKNKKKRKKSKKDKNEKSS